MPDDPDSADSTLPSAKPGSAAPPASGTIVRSDVAAGRHEGPGSATAVRGVAPGSATNAQGAADDTSAATFVRSVQLHTVDEGPVTPEAAGRYSVQREYGRGGQSRVLLAVDAHVGREIALKELLPEPAPGSTPVSQTAAAAARFLREARITGQLEHPNIVPVYEVGRHPDGTLYYTQKLVRGSTFKKALAGAGTLPERLKLLGHFSDICHAVAYAHSRSVIHRDLKPENVMVGEFGETVVLDWGLAKARGQSDLKAKQVAREALALRSPDATLEGQALGTPSYMSPEQAMGKLDEIDERSDVWSLGAILYEILTGAPPFDGDTAYSVIGKVIHDPVRPVRAVLPGAPPELAAVAERALSRDRTARYASARELAQEIEAYRAGRGVSAYAYSSVELFRRFVQKNRALSAVSALALVLVVAALVAVALEGRRARAALAQARTNLAAAFLEKAHNAERDLLWHRAEIFYAAARVHEDSPAARWGAAIEGEDASGVVRISGPAGEVTSVSLSADGKTVAAGAWDGTARIFSLETGRELWRYQAPSLIEVVALSPDGRFIGSRDTSGTVRLHEVATGAQVLTAETNEGARSIAFASGRLYAASSRGVHVLDPVAKETSLLPFPSARLAGCGNDRLLIATDKRLVLWDSALGQGLLALDVPEGRREIACAGDVLAAAFPDHSVRLWNSEGDELGELRGHADAVTHLSLSRDGARLVSTSKDRTVRLWSVQEATVLATLDRPAAVGWADFSGDGNHVAVAEQAGAVLVWDVAPGEQGLSGPAEKFAFLPDGGFVATGPSAEVGRWDKEGRLADLLHDVGPLVDLAVTFDGAQAATVLANGEVSVWDLRAGKLLRRLHAGAQRALFLPGGRLLADVGGKLTALEPAAVLATIDTHVEDWAVTPDGKLLVVHVYPARLARFELPSGRALPELSGTPATAMGLSPRGDRLAVGTYGKALLFDPLTLRPLGELPMEGAVPMSLAFSRDGALLAGSGLERTVRIFDTASRLEVANLPVPVARYMSGLSFSPDGRRLRLRITGATSTLGGVRFVRLADVSALPSPAEELAGVLQDHGVALDGTRIVNVPPPVVAR